MSAGKLSLKPYLLRAVHEWITDRGDTPQVVVNAERQDVAVPKEGIREGRIVLNISYQATRNLELGSRTLRFEARFSGVARRVSVPVDAVLCIFSRETGQGVVLTDQLAAAVGEIAGPSPTPPPRGTPRLRLVK